MIGYEKLSLLEHQLNYLEELLGDIAEPVAPKQKVEPVDIKVEIEITILHQQCIKTRQAIKAYTS